MFNICSRKALGLFSSFIEETLSQPLTVIIAQLRYKENNMYVHFTVYRTYCAQQKLYVFFHKTRRRHLAGAFIVKSIASGPCRLYDPPTSHYAPSKLFVSTGSNLFTPYIFIHYHAMQCTRSIPEAA